jgi:hypothetical protein
MVQSHGLCGDHALDFVSRLERGQCGNGGGGPDCGRIGIVAGYRRHGRIEQRVVELWELTTGHDLEAVWWRGGQDRLTVTAERVSARQFDWLAEPD